MFLYCYIDFVTKTGRDIYHDGNADTMFYLLECHRFARKQDGNATRCETSAGGFGMIQHFAVDKLSQTDCFSEMVTNPLIP